LCRYECANTFRLCNVCACLTFNKLDLYMNISTVKWSYSCEVMWYHLKRVDSSLNFGPDNLTRRKKKFEEYSWRKSLEV
jgi:hypothetical protein